MNNNFIINSFLKSYKTGTLSTKLQPNEVFYKTYEPIIKNIIGKFNIDIVNDKGEIEKNIDPEDYKNISSYIIYKDDFLYYIYTKKSFRRKGYAKKLLESSKFISRNINLRFLTESGYIFLTHIGKNVFYHPVIG